MAKYCEIRGNAIVLSSQAMQNIFGISDRTLTDWERQGCPKLDRGQWPLREVISWRSGAIDSTAAGNDAGKLRSMKLRAEAALKATQATKARREMEILDGEYMRKEDIEQEWAGRIVELKAGLMNWVKALPPTLENTGARAIEATLRREVVGLLEQYSRKGKYTPKTTNKPKTSKPKGAGAKKG